MLLRRSWNLGNATKMLRETLSWRCSYRPQDIKWEDVEMEGRTGKQAILAAADSEGRPVVFMRPRLQNTTQPERQIKHLIYHLEHASRMADEMGARARAAPSPPFPPAPRRRRRSGGGGAPCFWFFRRTLHACPPPPALPATSPLSPSAPLNPSLNPL